MKTFRSLLKDRLAGLMLVSAVLAVVVAFLAVTAITFISGNLIVIEMDWLDSLVNLIIGVLSGIGVWFMLPSVIVIIAGMFQEMAISRVEERNYPQARRSERPKFWPDALHDIKFTLWALFLNILVLPLHIFIIGVFVSIALNSYLVGREFFEMAAGYHLGKPQAHKLIRHNRRAVYGGGLVITLITAVPIINLFVPIVAVVWMVHVYHRIDVGVIHTSSARTIQ
jgi:CysZ protein